VSCQSQGKPESTPIETDTEQRRGDLDLGFRPPSRQPTKRMNRSSSLGCEDRASSGILWPAVVIGGIVLSVVVAGISTLVAEAWLIRGRPRKSPLERLQPYPPTPVADEAQRWLEEQQN
jgi:hypothetical protein